MQSEPYVALSGQISLEQRLQSLAVSLANMKTIGYLGQIDKLFGAPATTRSWNTILSVLRILKA